MKHLSDRITIDPGQCGGRPCVRGMRIRVTDVLDLYSAGLNANQILEGGSCKTPFRRTFRKNVPTRDREQRGFARASEEMPDLEEADLKACLQYASKRIDHPVLAA